MTLSYLVCTEKMSTYNPGLLLFLQFQELIISQSKSELNVISELSPNAADCSKGVTETDSRADHG